MPWQQGSHSSSRFREQQKQLIQWHIQCAVNSFSEWVNFLVSFDVRYNPCVGEQWSQGAKGDCPVKPWINPATGGINAAKFHRLNLGETAFLIEFYLKMKTCLYIILAVLFDRQLLMHSNQKTVCMPVLLPSSLQINFWKINMKWTTLLICGQTCFILWDLFLLDLFTSSFC